MTLSRHYLVCVVLLSLASCKEPVKEQENIVRSVKVYEIHGPEEFAKRTFPGKVEASQKADLSFPLPGELTKLTVREGDEIKLGQLIAEIDPTNYQIAVDEAKSKWELAKIELERTRKLREKDFATPAEYDAKKTAAEAAKARLGVAEKNLSDTVLLAPFEGEVAKRYVDNFQNVQAKQPVVRLQNRKNIDVEIQIPESIAIQTDKVKDAKYNVEFETAYGKQYPANVKEVATSASEDTQTYAVTLILPNPEGMLILPGMTAVVHVKAEIIDQGEQNIFVIPSTSVFSDEKGKSFVWLISPQSAELEKREVHLDRLLGKTVAVNKGLKPGEKIVATGVDFLKEGQKVKPFNPGE